MSMFPAESVNIKDYLADSSLQAVVEPLNVYMFTWASLFSIVNSKEGSEGTESLMLYSIRDLKEGAVVQVLLSYDVEENRNVVSTDYNVRHYYDMKFAHIQSFGPDFERTGLLRVKLSIHEHGDTFRDVHISRVALI